MLKTCQVVNTFIQITSVWRFNRVPSVTRGGRIAGVKLDVHPNIGRRNAVRLDTEPLSIPLGCPPAGLGHRLCSPGPALLSVEAAQAQGRLLPVQHHLDWDRPLYFSSGFYATS